MEVSVKKWVAWLHEKKELSLLTYKTYKKENNEEEKVALEKRAGLNSHLR